MVKCQLHAKVCYTCSCKVTIQNLRPRSFLIEQPLNIVYSESERTNAHAKVRLMEKVWVKPNATEKCWSCIKPGIKP